MRRDDWPGLIRPDTFDTTCIDEVYRQDVYRMRKWVRDRHVVDLGANVGVFAIWALALNARHVTAVEAVPENMSALAANVAAAIRRGVSVGERLSVVQAAIAGEEGREGIEFYGTSAGHYAYTHHGGDDVDAITLDSLTGDLDAGWVCKVDIEGSEYETLLAANLEGCSYIAIEFHGHDHINGRNLDPHSCGHLIEHLMRTHHVETLGSVEHGGYLYAHRYNQ